MRAAIVLILLTVGIENASANEKTRAVGVVRFDPESVQLSAAAMAELDQAAEELRADKRVSVLVSGHCDASGDAHLNQILTSARAQLVKLYLVTRGVAAGRIDVVSRGPSAPLASNDTAEGRALNRRVEVRIKVDARLSSHVNVD